VVVTGESINKSEYGRLVIQSIPTKETEDMVVSYLSRMVKNVSAPKLARKVMRTPFVLSKNIAAKKGEKIAQNLRDLGARAEFVPHDLEARASTRGSERALTPGIESLDMIYERNKPGPTQPPQSEGSAKRLITTVVVITLVAVFSLLAWQVFDLLTD
jgi:hypothetical protein